MAIKNVYTKGKVSGQEVHQAVINFIIAKGGQEVHNNEVDSFIKERFGVEYCQVQHVMHTVRKIDNRIIKGARGYSKYNVEV